MIIFISPKLRIIQKQKEKKPKLFLSISKLQPLTPPPFCDQHRRLVANPPPNTHCAKRDLVHLLAELSAYNL